MPRHCSAAGCKSRDTRETRKAGITFHRLPKRGKPRRTLWILNSRRTGPQGKGQWDPQSQFIYFCSKHFTPESFELSGVSGYRRLKEDALPTVFETLPRQRRAAAERAQRGASKQACAKRRTRRQSNSLKQEKEEPDPQTGAGPNVGGGAVVQDTEKTEEAGWEEDDLKSEGAAKALERTLPPAASPPPSSLPHPSPGLSHVPPASLAPPSPRPPSGPPPPPSETASSVPASTAAVPSPSSSSSPPPPSPPPSETPARPPSPSRYMRRLPPPPGFYLPREHSYAQLCPLVWKKRYDKALDSLEKSVRLLNAARRREARLRQTLLWLRETRVRHGFREGGGGRGRPAPGQGPGAREAGPAERGARQGAEPRESEAERSKEDLGLLEAGPGETGEWGDWAPPPPAKAGPGEDPGFCFYCGRGRGDGEGWDIPGKERPRGRPRKPWEGERDEEEEEEVDEEEEEEDDETGGETGAEECCYYYYCEDGEGGASGREAGLHLVTVEQAVPKPPGDPAAPGGPPQPAEPLLHAALQLQAMQPTQPMQLLQRGAAAPQCSLLAAAEGGGGGEQRLFWVQEGVEGRLVLLPVAAEEDGGGGAGRTGAEATAAGATVAAVAGGQAFQRLVVSAAGFQKAVAAEGERRGLEGGGGVPRTKGRGENQAETRTAAGSSDVRERLKEHLEGFQLQLSNEFIH
ncbi:THAP domain-containing protein 7 isoform X1 [Anguilla anguilla]|uniref:THAP domain-containing protein 7 isoform X1 n=1 Tax=Anguilla anguilla TaxID=7936 RepID=UPI0015B28C60|nr:THAP domain-containing protein 7 isoform X1 [Anguilla anguilla]XP_035287140.1 THAP domain-containing protein 7 isoform X1 [Anguilla anguilla]